MQRVLKYDGLLPAVLDANGKGQTMTPDAIKAMKTFIETYRTETTPFDIIMEGATPGHDRMQGAAIVQPWIEAGATWWIEAMWNAARTPEGLKDVYRRIQQGPPRQD